MFNLRRIKKAVDVSKKVNPKDIPGTTLEEKARYISDKLNNAVATEFLEGRKTEQQIIDMLSGETAPENLEQVKSTYPEEDLYKKKVETQPDPPLSRCENHLSTKTPAIGRVSKKKICWRSPT